MHEMRRKCAAPQSADNQAFARDDTVKRRADRGTKCVKWPRSCRIHEMGPSLKDVFVELFRQARCRTEKARNVTVI